MSAIRFMDVRVGDVGSEVGLDTDSRASAWGRRAVMRAAHCILQKSACDRDLAGFGATAPHRDGQRAAGSRHGVRALRQGIPQGEDLAGLGAAWLPSEAHRRQRRGTRWSFGYTVTRFVNLESDDVSDRRAESCEFRDISDMEANAEKCGSKAKASGRRTREANEGKDTFEFSARRLASCELRVGGSCDCRQGR